MSDQRVDPEMELVSIPEASIDDGIITLLRRHSTEGTVCSNIECAMDDPTQLKVVGGLDEFGFVKAVECGVCGEGMSTECYDKASKHKVRVYSATELKLGDHIAWHTLFGHWHNAIFVETCDKPSSSRHKTRITIVEYVSKGCGNVRVTESVREVDFHAYDVYRIVYKDAYTDSYSVERARRLTHPGTKLNALTGNCEDIARWCKTGHRSSKLTRIIQKLSGEKKALNVVQKTSTFVSMSLAEGLIPNTAEGANTFEVVVFTIVPAVAFFFSIALAQMKKEFEELQPRRENRVTSRAVGKKKKKTSSDDGSCCGCCDSSTAAENRSRRCRTYGGPLTRVFIREVIAIALPVATFVTVGYFVSGALPGNEWAVAAIELACALLTIPLAYALGVMLGSMVERLFCHCGPCGAAETSASVAPSSRPTSGSLRAPGSRSADTGPSYHVVFGPDPDPNRVSTV